MTPHGNHLETFAKIIGKLKTPLTLAVVFGFAGFVLTALLPRRTRPKQAVVSLVGTSLDPELSSPAANPATGNRYEVLEQKFEVGAIDCKFVNRGNATAFLDSFSVLVKGVTVDRAPVLSYSYRVRGRSVVVGATRAGARPGGCGCGSSTRFCRTCSPRSRR
ncbi:hypothetical protein [Amycolatopsis thermoflava]|uniref:hypothetical protein n=1 Tax=Amycolatopsis thermoflava TaxID=84480 RepID=UPI00382EE4B3